MSEESAKVALKLSGHVTGTRVLEQRNGHDIVEISYAADGTFDGHQVEALFTYEAEAISADSFVGTGKGILRATGGEGTASVKATGAARREAGATKLVWRVHGAVQSTSPAFADWHGRLIDLTIQVDDDQKITLRGVKWA
ncbi:hypothetical protein NX801_08900 [Streptomyces sp. LP05-1]|uniref:Uncharacterized protein n=1 Tax=Streptomyces pyxinae TaxID=2970734 RepID=A0ABT2CEF4_9ACTN|nr:hypothetical protein [Streptomyces sp. LP05-1]MCS0635780.1 hypothetical protein [Streptomyces sp. LP05-1]